MLFAKLVLPSFRRVVHIKSMIYVFKLVLPDERNAATHGNCEADEEGPARGQFLEEGAHDYVCADFGEA